MSMILHSYVHSFTTPKATARNPVRSVGHYGQTICFNAECSIDGSEAAVELTVEQAEELVLEIRAAIFAVSGRSI